MATAYMPSSRSQASSRQWTKLASSVSVSLLVRNANPASGELAAQVEVVVDLAVEDDRIPAILRGDRLMAAGDVDDGEPAHAEAEIPVR